MTYRTFVKWVCKNNIYVSHNIDLLANLPMLFYFHEVQWISGNFFVEDRSFLSANN